ncbi:MAG: hypothetical protein PG981_000905 [Wolbachia endosymbiont of Ctenocephalides orientis wCori]|nr:MAG: hypothetical protein PG981_000905 [Wolbachia endosymbiont of Ctenocephalides orientis wCori]
MSGAVKFGTKLCPILDCNTDSQKGLASEYMSICHEYEHLKSKCESAKKQEDVENLSIKYGDLKNEFKTEEEKYEESQKNNR